MIIYPKGDSDALPLRYQIDEKGVANPAWRISFVLDCPFALYVVRLEGPYCMFWSRKTSDLVKAAVNCKCDGSQGYIVL
jgi:hypothetical protein